MPQVKTAPPRNDLEQRPLDGASTGHKIGAPPGMHREYAHPDPKHPSYIGNFLKPKTFENGVTRQPYTVVSAPEEDPWLAMIRQRDDQGKHGGVDTKVYNGDLILVETTKENARLYDESIEAHNRQMDKALKSSKTRSGRISISEGTVTGNRGGAAPDAESVAFGRE